MLEEIAAGVLVRRSAFCMSNAVVVRGPDGVLLIDPGVNGADLRELADDLAALGEPVAAGFATHPHWDHVLWHPAFGDAARYGTARCADAARASLSRSRQQAERLAPGAPLDLIGGITPMPAGADRLPWPGPAVRVVEHQAHAPGHAALFVEEAGVLIAGDMLSDVEIPLLDLHASHPVEDYAEGLRLLAAAGEARAVVPGHGLVAYGSDIGARFAMDHEYLRALPEGSGAADPRLGPHATYDTDWLLEKHERHVRACQGNIKEM